MAFENISTDDFFPLFKQTLADSFKVDSFFMHVNTLPIRPSSL